MNNNATHIIAAVCILILMSVAGCNIFGPLTPGQPLTNDNGNSSNDNQNDNGVDNPGDVTVRLDVSNRTPQLNEQVTLQCVARTVSGDSVPPSLQYEFIPNSGQLIVDDHAGTARFIVSESDQNTSVQYTCRAVFDDGQRSAASNAVVISVAPAAPEEPLP